MGNSIKSCARLERKELRKRGARKKKSAKLSREHVEGGGVDSHHPPGLIRVKQMKSLFPKRVKSTFGTSEKNRFLWHEFIHVSMGKQNLDLKKNVFAWVI